MKKTKYILIGSAILIFIVCMLRFLWKPHSLSELFDANCMSITPEQGTSSFNCFNVQEYKGEKYFSDKGNLVSQKSNSAEKEIQVKNVGSFLIREDELVYTLSDEMDKVYVKNLFDNKVKNISIKNADILLSDNEYVYIYSEENILHKFDRAWNEEKIIDLREKGFKTHFERACIISGKLVFATESLKLYIYDEQEETLHKVEIPKGEEHSEGGDIVQWKGNVYYMRSYYNDGDLHEPFTRVDSSYNGIYQLNIDNKELKKVSNEVGAIMLIMNNQLCIADTHFWGISYWIDSVNVEAVKG